MKPFNASYYCVKQYGYIGVKAAKSGKMAILNGDSFIDCLSHQSNLFFSRCHNIHLLKESHVFLRGNLICSLFLDTGLSFTLYQDKYHNTLITAKFAYIHDIFLAVACKKTKMTQLQICSYY